MICETLYGAVASCAFSFSFSKRKEREKLLHSICMMLGAHRTPLEILFFFFSVFFAHRRFSHPFALSPSLSLPLIMIIWVLVKRRRRRRSWLLGKSVKGEREKRREVATKVATKKDWKGEEREKSNKQARFLSSSSAWKCGI